MSNEAKSRQTGDAKTNDRRTRRRVPRPKETTEQLFQAWIPQTELGRQIKDGKITSLREVFEQHRPIKEEEIVTFLSRSGVSETLSVGHVVRMTGSGGRRRLLAISYFIGDGFLGIGKAKGLTMFEVSKAATRQAKLRIRPVERGCGAWSCGCGGTPHTIPYKTVGKAGSVTIELIPAPRGTGLAIGDVGRKMLSTLGVRDIASRSFGHTRTTKNYALAVADALENLGRYMFHRKIVKATNIGEAPIDTHPEEQMIFVKESSITITPETSDEQTTAATEDQLNE